MPPNIAPHPTNRALAGAWRAGFQAHSNAEPLSANPYATGHQTLKQLYARKPYANAWTNGWQAAHREPNHGGQ